MENDLRMRCGTLIDDSGKKRKTETENVNDIVVMCLLIRGDYDDGDRIEDSNEDNDDDDD